jgi:hypothetical protein
MVAVVIDTNVLLVANGKHANVSHECRTECVKQLLTQRKTGLVVIDDGYRILSEYRKKTSPNQPKGVGDAFLKWLLQNQANPTHVNQVHITELAPNIFAEFPDEALQPQFDADDRKFIAVANAHANKPPVLQAADSKWLGWSSALSKKGVHVRFLCPEDSRAAYRKKFPKRSIR